MSEIKRYEPYIVDVKDDPTNGALKQASMCEVPDGRYMLVADHEAILMGAAESPVTGSGIICTTTSENVFTGNRCFDPDKAPSDS